MTYTPPQLPEKAFPVLIGAGEEEAGLDPGQGGRTLLNDDLLRHGQQTRFSKMPRSADRELVWHRSMTVSWPLISLRAIWTIL